MYSLNRDKVKFKVLNKSNKIKEIYFTSPYKSGYPEVDQARALLHQGNRSEEAIVFVHGTGRHFSSFSYYPKILSNNGYTTLMLILPYHYERISKKDPISLAFLKGSSEVLEKKYEQSVVDIFTCVDYLQQQGFKKIHIMGFSLGGMIATIASALDKRIDKVILTVTGGNFEYSTWHSTATKIFRIEYEEDKSCNPKKCHQIHQEFDKAAKEWKNLEELKKYPSCFRYDPSFFAAKLNPKDVVMFTALFDECVPRKSSDDLWERIGKPKRYFLLSGHLTAHLFYKNYILRKTLKFLEEG